MERENQRVAITRRLLKESLLRLLRQHREIEDLKLQKTSAAFCGRGTLNFPCWGMAN